MNDATEKLKDLIMEIFDARPSTAEKCVAILDNIKAIIENEEMKRTKAGCEYWDSESSFCALHRPADLVRHGGWIKMSDRDGIYWACSECGEELLRFSHYTEFDLLPRLKSIDRTNYCPHCGAKMERSEE